PRKLYCRVAGIMAEIDHVGIAVRDLAAASRVYRLLGMAPQAGEEIAAEGVRVAMVPAGASRIELLEPTRTESPVGRFLARHGEGMHHVALRVSGLEAMAARLREAGVQLVRDEVRVGAGGHRYLFLHPASSGGVLIELVED
ncbi:MAG: methylmalonyl-CoA epimerase, partial [Terriglobales bacterium]